jgi:hypothetical protein
MWLFALMLLGTVFAGVSAQCVFHNNTIDVNVSGKGMVSVAIILLKNGTFYDAYQRSVTSLPLLWSKTVDESGTYTCKVLDLTHAYSYSKTLNVVLPPQYERRVKEMNVARTFSSYAVFLTSLVLSVGVVGYTVLKGGRDD